MIDVAFTPAQLRPADRAVVIDVLRATSTATVALTAGYARVRFAATLEDARALRTHGRVLAGERRCAVPEGFDQGNSPSEAALRRGDELIMATTNGTPAIVAATRVAATVYLGCLLNLAAVVERLLEEPSDLLLVCSGTDGAPAIEDIYVAGRISAALEGERTDAALLAESVAAGYTAGAALRAGAGARALRAVGLDRDISDCARESVLEVVGMACADADGGTSAVALMADPVGA